MLNWKVTSTKFIAELQARKRSFAGRTMTMTLVVPPELKWWYWLEWGTSGKSFGPKNAKALRWFAADGSPVIRDHVDWPGIRPHAFVRKVWPEIQQSSLRLVYQALVKDGFRLSAIKSALQDVGENAKSLVTESLATETKSIAREDSGANIPGFTAAEAFTQKATIKIE